MPESTRYIGRPLWSLDGGGADVDADGVVEGREDFLEGDGAVDGVFAEAVAWVKQEISAGGEEAAEAAGDRASQRTTFERIAQNCH